LLNALVHGLSGVAGPPVSDSAPGGAESQEHELTSSAPPKAGDLGEDQEEDRPSSGYALIDQEFVVHAFAAAGGPLAESTYSQVRGVWASLAHHFGMTEPIVGLQLSADPPSEFLALPSGGVVAARQNPRADRQLILRRELDMFNLSVVVVPPPRASGRPLHGDGVPARRQGWGEVDQLWDEVTPVLLRAGLDVTRVYQAKVTGEWAALPDAVRGIAVLVRESLPDAAAGSAPELGSGLLVSDFVVWELRTSAADAERRLVVVGPENHDAELSAWTWSTGDVAMPRLAHYLMHVARIRYQERIWNSERATAERLAKRQREEATELQRMVDATAKASASDQSGMRRAAAAIRERILVAQAQAAAVLTDIKAMERAVEIAAVNMEVTLDMQSPQQDRPELTATLLGGDLEFADRLIRSLAEGAARIEEAQRAARRAVGIASRTIPPQGVGQRPASSSAVAGTRLAGLKMRLDEAIAENDLASLLDPGIRAEALRLTEILDESGDLEARYVLGWFHWLRFLALPEGQDNGALMSAASMFTPCFVSGLDGLPEPLLPLLAERAAALTETALERALDSGDSALLSASISLWFRIVNALAADDLRRVMWLSNLGVALRTLFERTGDLASLDAAIQAGRAAADAFPAGHPDRAAALSNLGVALRTRFECTGDLPDLDAAIEAGRAAVDAAAGHPGLPMALSNLAGTLQARYLMSWAISDLDAATEAARAAVGAAPPSDPDRAKYLSNLGIALQARFERSSDQADLDAAIEAGQAAVDALGANHPDRSAALANLQRALQSAQDHG
jgi:tetratricopeptide (TPR) repeat protein